MKMEMKVNNRSDRYDIIRPMPRHEHKYSKYKKSLGKMMLILYYATSCYTPIRNNCPNL